MKNQIYAIEEECPKILSLAVQTVATIIISRVRRTMEKIYLLPIMCQYIFLSIIVKNS